MVSSSNRFFLLLATISLCQAVSLPAKAQDPSWLLDVARANAESMQNYDVSYKITRLKDETAKLDADKPGTVKMPKWDEQRIIGRLVLDKASVNKPTKLLHARTVELLYKEKVVQQYMESTAWDEGVGITYASYIPNGEIPRGPLSLGYVYTSQNIPFFEIGNGRIQPPSEKSYWNDEVGFWEASKIHISKFTLSRSPSGTLRLELSRDTDRLLKLYDPVSNLCVSESIFSNEPQSKVERKSPVSARQIAWENSNGVYRVISYAEQISTPRISQNEIGTFHWHQFNVEAISFPQDVFTDFSVDKCTKFLAEGQSELR